jgi:hypothetical protein
MTKLNELEDEDRVLKDGQTLRTPMFMMDSLQRLVSGDTPSTAGYRPGSLAMTDADRNSREKLYEARDKRLIDAWKNAPPLDPAQAKTAIVPATSAERYAARDTRLENAWRSA